MLSTLCMSFGITPCQFSCIGFYCMATSHFTLSDLQTRDPHDHRTQLVSLFKKLHSVCYMLNSGLAMKTANSSPSTPTSP